MKIYLRLIYVLEKGVKWIKKSITSLIESLIEWKQYYVWYKWDILSNEMISSFFSELLNAWKAARNYSNF